MPTNDRESSSFNPTLHHNIQKAVNAFLTRTCNAQELKDVHKSNTRKKLIPVRLVPEFSKWFEGHVVDRMTDFLKSHLSEPEVEQILASNIIKMPTNLVTRFVALFRRLEEEEHPPIDIYQLTSLKPKKQATEKSIQDHSANAPSAAAVNRKVSLPKKSDFIPSIDENDDFINWVDLVQNHFRSFDFPVTEQERSMYHPSIHQRITKMVNSFLSRECTSTELRESKKEKRSLIPTRLAPNFLARFKKDVIDAQVAPTQDMLWREVLKEFYPSYEPPTHQLSASYVEMLDGIEQFLQAECTPEELTAQSGNSRRKKIPARLIPEFVSWFRSEYRMDYESSSEDEEEDKEEEEEKSENADENDKSKNDAVIIVDDDDDDSGIIYIYGVSLRIINFFSVSICYF